MTEPIVQYLAVTITLIVLTQPTQGSNHLNEVEPYGRKQLQPWKNSERRILKYGSMKRRSTRGDPSKDTLSVVNKTTHGLNDRQKIVHQGINDTVTDQIRKSVRTKITNVGFFDQKEKPFKEFQDSFNRVFRKRRKRPRQEIEFIEDNQGSEAKQNANEGPRYQEVTGNDNSENRENSDNVGYGNSYVTIIDKDDGKADTDSYNTLSSDLAKSEYANVESSINEGENEESQLLDKEVNDVMGALTKSDSRIKQFVGGVRETPGKSDNILPLKQGETTANDDVIISVDGNKEDTNGAKNRPPSPPPVVTVIEDHDEVNPSENTHPVLNKNVWDVIEQVAKNFTIQDQAHRGEELQSGRAANTTHWPSYLPPPKNMPTSGNLRQPGNSLNDLESNLKIFDGSKKNFEDNRTKNTPEIVVSNHDQAKIVLSGEAEEGVKDKSPDSQVNVSLPHLHQVENEYTLKGKSQSYDQSAKLKANSSGEDDALVFNSSGKIRVQMDNYERNNTRPLLLSPHAREHSFQKASEEQSDGGGPKIDKHKRPENESSYTVTPKDVSEGHKSSLDLPPEALNSTGVKQSNEGIESNVRFNKAAVNITNTRQDGNLAQENMPYMNTNYTSLTSKAGLNGNDLFKVPVKVNPEDVRIIVVKPTESETSSTNSPVNRTTSFQGNGYYNRPKGHQAFLSETYQHNSNNTNDLEHADSRLQKQQGHLESTVDSSPNQKYDPSANIKVAIDNQESAHGQGDVLATQDNAQAALNTHHESEGVQTGSDASHRQNKMSSQMVHTGNSSLESWSGEYLKLVQKLTKLYQQTRENTSLASTDNPEIYDVEKMMKEVSRFHTLFTGRNREHEGNGNYEGNNGKLKKEPEDESKESNLENGKMINSSKYLSYEGNNENGKGWNAHDAQNKFLARARVYKDVTGEVRSIQTLPNPHTNTRREEIKVNATFVNQALAFKQRSSDNLKSTNSSEPISPKDTGPSSHQVLMSYFRNETDLRKHLQNETGIQTAGFAVSEMAERKDQDNQLGNGTNHADGADSNVVEEELSTNDGNVLKILPNDSTLPWPSQVRNVSNEEEEGSLAKYIQDFISMISPNKTVESSVTNGTLGWSSPNDVSTLDMVTTSSSEASKKENVTDMKNRVIIEVSPQSLKDLMKNRSHSSALLPAKKADYSVTGGKTKNITAKLESSALLNETAQTNMSKLSGKIPIGNQVLNRLPTQRVANDSSKKETDVSERKKADMNLFYREELKSLEISLSRDFMSGWIYYQKSLDEIGITPRMLRSGIANLGSSQRLRSVFKKALAGIDVNVLVVGGSISAGGGIEKDRGNIEGVYHKAFSDWWNKTVTPITTSQLKINTVAIGGTDSEYFSYCVKNYMRSLPDIVIWELAANDYQRYKGRNFAPAKPLEQLTRIILSLPSHPALILANFFRGNYYRTAVGQDCPDSEDEGGKTIAQYYQLTSLSWRNVICSSLAGQELDLQKLFSSDGYHPSILGHAQMSTLLISYLKGIFEETISREMTLSRNHTVEVYHQDLIPTTLPKPIFDDPEFPKPYCWTLLTPDYGGRLRNTLPDLEFTEATGFQFANISHWPVRRDRLRCLKAMQTGATLKMKFVVPSHEDQDSGDNRPHKERELAITTHNSFGGMGVMWVDDNQQEAKIIKEEGGQRRTQVDVLTRTLVPGVHTVTVSALQPGFCLSAVAVL